MPDPTSAWRDRLLNFSYSVLILFAFGLIASPALYVQWMEPVGRPTFYVDENPGWSAGPSAWPSHHGYFGLSLFVHIRADSYSRGFAVSIPGWLPGIPLLAW